MKIRIFGAIAILGLAMPAAAELYEVESRAYELGLQDFVAPATINGTTAFKPCSTCDRERVRVDARTEYSVDGKRVRFADFRKALLLATDRDSVFITVMHHLESDVVLSIDVWL